MQFEIVQSNFQPAFFISNSEPAPEFEDMPFEDIEELPIDHPGAHDARGNAALKHPESPEGTRRAERAVEP